MSVVDLDEYRRRKADERFYSDMSAEYFAKLSLKDAQATLAKYPDSQAARAAVARKEAELADIARRLAERAKLF